MRHALLQNKLFCKNIHLYLEILNKSIYLVPKQPQQPLHLSRPIETSEKTLIEINMKDQDSRMVKAY